MHSRILSLFFRILLFQPQFITLPASSAADDRPFESETGKLNRRERSCRQQTGAGDRRGHGGMSRLVQWNAPEEWAADKQRRRRRRSSRRRSKEASEGAREEESACNDCRRLTPVLVQHKERWKGRSPTMLLLLPGAGPRFFLPLRES